MVGTERQTAAVFKVSQQRRGTMDIYTLKCKAYNKVCKEKTYSLCSYYIYLNLKWLLQNILQAHMCYVCYDKCAMYYDKAHVCYDKDVL